MPSLLFSYAFEIYGATNVSEVPIEPHILQMECARWGDWDPPQVPLCVRKFEAVVLEEHISFVPHSPLDPPSTELHGGPIQTAHEREGLLRLGRKRYDQNLPDRCQVLVPVQQVGVRDDWWHRDIFRVLGRPDVEPRLSRSMRP